MLEIKNLTYKKGRALILNDLSLTIEDKSIYIITGENGCGKTTLLKIITKGIRSNKINSTFSSIFYLSDKFVLPNVLVRDFLYKTIEIFKYSINVDKLMFELELPNKKIKQLSKGNYKKVAIIYSFLINSDLIIYDEILDGLDPNIVKKVVRLIKKLNKTIIIVSHFVKSFRYLKYNHLIMSEGMISYDS